MAPVVHGLEAEYYGKIDFTFLDIDDPANDEFKRALGFRGQPQFFLLGPDGTIIQSWLGTVSAESFREAFDSVVTQ
jgi:hypothetical protein